MIRYLSVNWTLPGQFWRCCRAQRLPLRFQHTTLTLPKHLFVVKTSWLCNWCPNLPSACLWWVQSQLWTHTHPLKKPSGLSYELSVTSDLMDLTAAQFFFLLYTHTHTHKSRSTCTLQHHHQTLTELQHSTLTLQRKTPDRYPDISIRMSSLVLLPQFWEKARVRRTHICRECAFRTLGFHYCTMGFFLICWFLFRWLCIHVHSCRLAE